MKVIRGIFGLAHSPRLWWKQLRDFLKSIGGKQCALDKALFAFYDKKCAEVGLILILGIHVDVIVAAAKPVVGEKTVEQIKKQFELGKWFDSTMTYCGKEITHTIAPSTRFD